MHFQKIKKTYLMSLLMLPKVFQQYGQFIKLLQEPNIGYNQKGEYVNDDFSHSTNLGDVTK